MTVGATFAELINKTFGELSQVPGIGTQTFSEDIVGAKLQKIFNIVWSELWWDEYMQWFSGATDKSTGVINVDLSSIKEFKDIRGVFRRNSDRPLPLLPRDKNPNNITSGTTAIYIEPIAKTSTSPAANKIFRVLPVTTDETLDLHARVKPDDFDGDDKVYIDEDLLVIGTAWDYTEGDGTNPGEAEKLKNQFEARLLQLKHLSSQQPITISDPRADIPDQWFTNP